MYRAEPEDEHRSVTGSDLLQLDIRTAPPGGRTDWLTARLRQAIADGRLPVGSRLPPTRVLAADLGVSRGVVTEAIRRHLPGAVVHGAAVGFHLMITFTGAGERVVDVDFAAAALARGVKAQPLNWHRQRPGVPGLVLGYAANPPSEIERAVGALGAALRDVLP